VRLGKHDDTLHHAGGQRGSVIVPGHHLHRSEDRRIGFVPRSERSGVSGGHGNAGAGADRVRANAFDDSGSTGAPEAELAIAG